MNDFEVMYTCRECGLSRQIVMVRRRRHSEDILSWMESVVAVACGNDHCRKMPWCKCRSVDLLVPMTDKAMAGEEGIGTTPGPMISPEKTPDIWEDMGSGGKKAGGKPSW